MLGGGTGVPLIAAVASQLTADGAGTALLQASDGSHAPCLAGAALPVSPVLQLANVCISIPYAYITRFGQCCTSDWRPPFKSAYLIMSIPD